MLVHDGRGHAVEALFYKWEGGHWVPADEEIIEDMGLIPERMEEWFFVHDLDAFVQRGKDWQNKHYFTRSYSYDDFEEVIKMKVTDGKRTVEVRTVFINNFGSGDISADLLVDSTMKYDSANDIYHVQSVQDVLDYCQDWEDEDPDNRYFDWEDVEHDDR